MNKIIIFVILSMFSKAWAQQSLDLFEPVHHAEYFNDRGIQSPIEGYDMVYQCLNFEVDPSILYIKGEVLIFYKAVSTLDTLKINLSQNLQVDSVVQNSQLCLFSHQNQIITINIADIGMGESDALIIYYRGVPSQANESFFIGVQDSTSMLPVLATLSEPYGSSDWWPCKDNLTDKIDSIDINITCPLGQKAASMGLLKGIDTLGGQVTYRWQHRYPIMPYLVSIAVSNYYEQHSYIHFVGGDSLLFMNFLYQQSPSSSHIMNSINSTPNFMRVYDSLFIPYPFLSEKYGHAEFLPHGGMEHQTLSSMGAFGFEIVSHELAHQWFGDYITCGSWSDLWLNEGFATYCTGLCYEALSNHLYWPLWKSLVVPAITSVANGSVYPVDTLNVPQLFSSRLTYYKAAYVLHMIRWTIGDEDFFQGIRNYLNNQDLAFSTARTPDLVGHFEQQADTSLSQFIDDWFYGEGYPMYTLTWFQHLNNNVSIQLEQTSSMDDGHVFELYVPVWLIGANDTLKLRLKHTEVLAYYNYPLNFEIDTVLFDPEFEIISSHQPVIQKVEALDRPVSKIFPNPAIDEVRFFSNAPIENLSVINITGQKMPVNFDGQILDVSTYKEGIYWLNYQLHQQQYSYKLEIIR